MARPATCPDPLCIRDLKNPEACTSCYCELKKHRGWGGRRPGAGAPAGNLNHLVNGVRSKLMRRAVEKLAADPELRVYLFLIAQAASAGGLSPTIRKLIRHVLMTPQAKGRRAYRKVAAARRLP